MSKVLSIKNNICKFEVIYHFNTTVSRTLVSQDPPKTVGPHPPLATASPRERQPQVTEEQLVQTDQEKI